MSNSEIIAKHLLGKGYTLEGICGILGNLAAESNIENIRLEGDFESSRIKSYAYMNEVDELISNGRSVEQYVLDRKGWGIYQLTYETRKRGFFSYCKSKGKSIGDLITQVDYLEYELRTDFPTVCKYCKENNLFNASYYFLKYFENPKDVSGQITFRYNLGLGIYDSLKNVDFGEVEDAQQSSAPVKTLTATFAPFQQISAKTASKYDPSWVLALRWMLYKDGYAVDTDTQEWDEGLTETVMAFQKDNGLDADGVCGKLTWKAVICYE